MSAELEARVRSILDSPRPGLLGNDISDLMKDAAALRGVIAWIEHAARPYRPRFIAGIEARGFLFGPAVASALGCGFVMLRRKGKLPGSVLSREYRLEYGVDTLELRADALLTGQRVVLIDDLLASGGTLRAAVSLLREAGAMVAAAVCVVELTFLKGRASLDLPVETLVTYDE